MNENMRHEKAAELFELGVSIKKQLREKNAKHNITNLGHLITTNADKEIILDYFMKIINGYDVKVDLNPLADIVNTDEFNMAIKAVLMGMLSK